MKKCVNCGAPMDDTTKFCQNCDTPMEESKINDLADSGSFVSGAAGASTSVQNPAEQPVEHMVKGILGAILFSLAGVALYVVLYELGYLAWISAAVMFVAAAFGYRKLSGTGVKTVKSLVIAGIVTVIMIFVSECICLGIDIYLYADIELSLIESLLIIPAALAESEIRSVVLSDLGFMYIVCAIVFVIDLVGKVRRRR